MWKQIGENISNYKSYPRIVGETGGKDFVMVHPSADVDTVVTALADLPLLNELDDGFPSFKVFNTVDFPFPASPNTTTACASEVLTELDSTIWKLVSLFSKMIIYYDQYFN